MMEPVEAARPAQPPAPWEPGFEISGLIVDSLLSEGPFSWLYLATEPTAGEQVVIKLARWRADLRPQDPLASQPLDFSGPALDLWEPDPRALLEREYACLSAIYHPFVARCHAGGRWGDLPYLVLEYATGGSLRERLAAGEQVPLEYLQQLASALDDLSETDLLVCHGDLKPENLVLRPEGMIQMIDPAAIHWTQTGDFPGKMIVTPGYNPYFNTDDLPSLGILLWELVTGQHPLLPPPSVAPREPLPFGERLLALMDWFAAHGRHLVTDSLPYLILPAGSDPQAPPLAIALRAMGLKIGDDGRLDLTEPYGSMTEFAAALGVHLATAGG